MINHALHWASLGFRVFPCEPGRKEPLGGTLWQEVGTSDADGVRRLWARSPMANIAVVVGDADIVVIDVDAPEHEILSRLDQTWVQRTPSGGWHYVYRQPTEGARIRNVGKGVIADHVETRGEGGYFLAAPSVVRYTGKDAIKKNVADGHEGTYVCVVDMEPQPIPQWIVDKIRAHEAAKLRPRALPATISTHETWGRGRLRAIVDRLQREGVEGNRSNALIQCASAAGRIVGGGHISYGEAYAELWAVAGAWDNKRKTSGTLKRGLEHGQTNPVHPEPGLSPFAMVDTSVIDWDALIGGVTSSDSGEEVEIIDVETKRQTAENKRDEALWRVLAKVRACSPVADMFAGWCLRTSPYPQPMLTVGAIVALGGIMGARRWSYRGVTSNTYVVLLAETASGKSAPQSCLETVLRRAALRRLGPGSIASAKSLFGTLKKAAEAGIGSCHVLDEYGDKLAAMLGRKGGAGDEIHSWLLVLATIGTRTVTWGNSATDGGGMEQIDGPALQILGGTTPAQLHRALSGDGVLSGLIGRHLWCEGLAALPVKNRDAHLAPGLPQSMVDAIAAIERSDSEWRTPAGSKVAPDLGAEVLEDDAARDMLIMWDDANELAKKAKHHPRAPVEIVARGEELVKRVALSLAVLDSGGHTPCVSEAHMEAAIAVIEASYDAIGRTLRDDAAPTAAAAAMRDVVRAVKRGATTQREILRSCRQLTLREVHEQLARGQAEGLWDLQQQDNRGRIVVLPLAALDG